MPYPKVKNMTREIKFRAYDKRTKRMKLVAAIWFSFASGPEKIDIGDGLPQANPEECILMLYTGLLDKNGKEIFEGDIVKAVLDEISVERVGDVQYQTTFARYGYTAESLGFGFDPDNWQYEIIGNIYNNKNLII